MTFTVGLVGDGKPQTRIARRFNPGVWIDSPDGTRVKLTATHDDATGQITYTLWSGSPKASGCTCTDHQHHPLEPLQTFTVPSKEDTA